MLLPSFLICIVVLLVRGSHLIHLKLSQPADFPTYCKSNSSFFIIGSVSGPIFLFSVTSEYASPVKCVIKKIFLCSLCLLNSFASCQAYNVSCMDSQKDEKNLRCLYPRYHFPQSVMLLLCPK